MAKTKCWKSVERIANRYMQAVEQGMDFTLEDIRKEVHYKVFEAVMKVVYGELWDDLIWNTQTNYSEDIEWHYKKLKSI